MIIMNNNRRAIYSKTKFDNIESINNHSLIVFGREKKYNLTS